MITTFPVLYQGMLRVDLRCPDRQKCIGHSLPILRHERGHESSKAVSVREQEPEPVEGAERDAQVPEPLA